MARAFAYDPSGLPIDGVDRLNKLYIQKENLDFSKKPGGITWWQGPNEDLGYVIASTVSGANRPTPVGNIGTVKFNRTNGFSETEFVNLSNLISGQSFTTGSEAKVWLNANGYWTSYETVYTPTLKVWLDAGNTDSYPTRGTVWSDLSGSANNARLFNTPTYSALSGGFINFNDTAFQYATIANIGTLSTWTLESWVRIKSSLTGKVTMVVGNAYSAPASLNFSLGTNNAPDNYNMTAGFFDGQWKSANGYSLAVDTWYHLVGTYDGSTVALYVNGSLESSLRTSGTPKSGGEIRIARRWDSTADSASNFLKSDISIIRVYASALDQSAILGNFNASRHRYSL